MATTNRHSKFYFDSIVVTIQVEDTLFNVHKYQLMKSEAFSDMFKTVKSSTEGSEEGSSTENPIVLLEVSAVDFECLLTMLYAGRFSSQQPTLNASIITSAFRLANKWNFEDLRASLLSLAKEKLDVIDKIVFAREFGLTEWLVPAHTRLCLRPEPLNTEEA
ncbi:The BTB (BR-C, ttk and bab)/POZ (Pox virus and Zinc finger) domain [Ceratobasidium sp. AG-Ba]|nr:The BTB (BR-C, ttk and bab)/POZ (Pox virus and Zinc finger) domain [Ceratobasidium sp. AG-Ba]